MAFFPMSPTSLTQSSAEKKSVAKGSKIEVSLALLFKNKLVKEKVFLLWLHLFLLSGVISPLISSSILGAGSQREELRPRQRS